MSSSVLRDRLKELTQASIVETDDGGRYWLSEHGRRLLTALRPLSKWADEWSGTAEKGNKWLNLVAGALAQYFKVGVRIMSEHRR